MDAIVRDEDIRSGDPRIEGTRITVLDIKRRVIDGDGDPFAVAAEYELDVAAVYQALAYYYDNAETLREREAAGEKRRLEGRKESKRLREQHGEPSVTEPT